MPRRGRVLAKAGELAAEVRLFDIGRWDAEMRVRHTACEDHPLRQHGVCAGTRQVGEGGLSGLRGARAEALARKYVWWQPAERTLATPRVLAAQIMTLGVLEDVRWLHDRVSREEMRAVLRDPPVGIFNQRSWRFWHLQLGVIPIPSLPVRPLSA